MEEKIKRIQNTTINRFQNNEKYVSLSFKTYLSDVSYGKEKTLKYINPYSYLEIVNYAVNETGNFKKFALNTHELIQLKEKMEKIVTLITENGQRIVNGEIDISQYNFIHVCDNAFQNAQISMYFHYYRDEKKIFVTGSYNNPSNNENYYFMNDIPWQRFKTFVEEIKMVLNNWFLLQNQNISLYQLDENVNNHTINSNDIIVQPTDVPLNITETKTEEIKDVIEVKEDHQINIDKNDENVTNNYNHDSDGNTENNSFFNDIQGFENDHLEVNGLEETTPTNDNDNTSQNQNTDYMNVDPMTMF